jgi:homoserine kinase
VTIEARPSSPLRLELIERGTPLGKASDQNAVSAVAIAIAKDFRIRSTLRITLQKGVPVGVGLGSSAASSAAAAVAMDSTFELGLTPPQLIRYAGEGERASSGTPHLDNVSAAIMGGFVVVGSGLDTPPIRFEPPSEMKLCLATPSVRLPPRKTEYARSLLPLKVDLAKTTQNLLMASTLLSGFAFQDIEMIGRGMHDVVVEPSRRRLVPGYPKVREAALAEGASGVCISGAGPTVLALVGRQANSTRVLRAMLLAFKGTGVDAKGFVTSPGDGARVMELD